MTGKKKRTIILAIAAVLLALVVWTVWGNTALELNTYTVGSKELPDAFDGYRIAHVSDLHNAEMGDGNEKLLAVLREADPDIIAITGDLIDSRNTNIEVALAFAEKAMKIAPCYYVTGNHEFWTGRVDEVKARLEERGAVVLAGECVTVTAAGQTVQLCGIDDPSVGETRWREQLEAVTAALDGEHCSILMTHRPERTEDYAGRGFELVLAGHAHGGQWRLPGLLNGLFAPDQGLFPTYAGGRYALGDTTLLVSRGLARESTRLPRFYNRPELVVVELRPGLEEFPAKKE